MNGDVFVRGEYSNNQQTRRSQYQLTGRTPELRRPVVSRRGWLATANNMLRTISEDTRLVLGKAVRGIMANGRRRGWTPDDVRREIARRLSGDLQRRAPRGGGGGGGGDRVRLGEGREGDYIFFDVRGLGGQADWLDRIISALHTSGMQIREIHLHFHTPGQLPVLTIYLIAPLAEQDRRRRLRDGTLRERRRHGGRRKTRRKRRRRKRRKTRRQKRRKILHKRRTRRRKR